MKTKEPITLRQKSLNNGRKSLYLDFYQQGNKNHAHKYEFLKLYLLPETSKENRDQNRETLKIANAIKAQRMLDYINGKANMKPAKAKNILLVDYMQHFAEVKKQYGQSKERAATINQVIDHIRKYNGNVLLSTVDKKYCAGFAAYLAAAKSIKNTKTPKVLSKYTANVYYTVLIATLNHAVREELIPANPADKVTTEERKAITPNGNTRVYLSIDELQRLIDAPCGNEQLRSAFLFACFTGLRISDIRSLTWTDIKTENEQMFICKEMIKTKRNVHVPIGATAATYLPAKTHSNVFSLPTEPTINVVLKNWAKRAEIDKNISFHTSRHTFATMLLTKGADLYTTSKLLGHTNISTTQVYAEIVNAKRVEAINLLDNL